MTGYGPSTLPPERRKTVASPLQERSPSFFQILRFPKGLFIAAGLFFLLSVPPLFGADDPEPADRIGPEARWSPEPAVMEKIRTDCSPLAGVDFETCFMDGMKQAGASPQALAFAGSIGGPGYMQALHRHGPVDVALVVYPFRANENHGFLLLNGRPPRIDVDDVALLGRDKLLQDSRYARLKGAYPALTLWPGDRSEKDFPEWQRTPDGGQRFLVRYRLLNGCHACELAGYVRYVFDFDRTGRFLGTAYAGIEGLADDRGRDSADAAPSDPAVAVHVMEGRTFSLTLRANPTTGYLWQLAEPLHDRLVCLEGRAFRSDQSGLMGSGGREIWTFRALERGETLIGFNYIRPWEKDAAPSETVRFRIIVFGDGEEGRGKP